MAWWQDDFGSVRVRFKAHEDREETALEINALHQRSIGIGDGDDLSVPDFAGLIGREHGDRHVGQCS